MCCNLYRPTGSRSSITVILPSIHSRRLISTLPINGEISRSRPSMSPNRCAGCRTHSHQAPTPYSRDQDPRAKLEHAPLARLEHVEDILLVGVENRLTRGLELGR